MMVGMTFFAVFCILIFGLFIGVLYSLKAVSISKNAKFEYPIAFVHISDDFLQYQSDNARLIKYEYDKQSDKIRIDTHVSKKCLKLIQRETVNILKKIFDTV